MQENNIYEYNLEHDIKKDNDGIDEELVYYIADFFKVLGDATRIKILYELSKRELCVHEISMILNISQSATSHQLRILRQSNLVKFKRKGKAIYYSLDDGHVEHILEQGIEHILHKKYNLN